MARGRIVVALALVAAELGVLLGADARFVSPAEISREVFLRSPRAGVTVLAASFYTRPSGGELLSLHQLMSRSDTVDVAFMRTSPDNGRTWSEAVEVPTLEVRAGGKSRRALRGGVADPRTGRFVRFQIEGLLPTDDPLEGMRQWTVTYQV